MIAFYSNFPLYYCIIKQKQIKSFEIINCETINKRIEPIRKRNYICRVTEMFFINGEWIIIKTATPI